MHVFVAVFLVTLVVDAVLRIGGSHAVWPLVLTWTVVLYVAVGLTTKLPKKVFLPIAFFVFWRATGALPLPLYLSGEAIGQVVAWTQLGVALAGVAWMRARTRGRWIPGEPDLSGGFRLRRLVGFGLANVLLVPPALALYFGSFLAVTLDRETKGWMRITFTGVHAKERVYERGSKTVRLVAMMHVGQRRFYEDTARSFAGEDVVILAEGTTDHKGLLRDGLHYGEIAKVLGLESQHVMDLQGLDVEWADVDVASFHPDTIAFLNETARILAAEDLPTVIQRYREIDERLKRVPDTLRTDLIHRRNSAVNQKRRECLEEYSVVVVPWGAAHMPGIESDVLSQGFVLTETKSRRVIGFIP